MNNKLTFLFLIAFLASTDTYAQPIQFSNGDTLNVELIFQTDSTITFFHPALGERNIYKSKKIHSGFYKPDTNHNTSIL